MSLRIPSEDEWGDANRENFQKQIDDAFADSNLSGNGLLTKEEFREFTY